MGEDPLAATGELINYLQQTGNHRGLRLAALLWQPYDDSGRLAGISGRVPKFAGRLPEPT